MLAGNVYSLKILRKTDIGYMLEDENKEAVFLHNNDLDNQQINENDIVSAFLYLDSHGRLTATLKTPKIVNNRYGFLKVVGVNPKMGVWLDNNTTKDILLKEKKLPKDFTIWPQVNDYLYVKLDIKKKMECTRVERDFIFPKAPEVISSYADGYVYFIGNDGFYVLTKNINLVFIPFENTREKHRLGQALSVRIISVNPKTNNYNGSLILNKENQIYDDASIIMNYLKLNQNKMPLTAKSSSEEVEKKLHISKKAFKRALGNLYKDRLVEFTENETILIKEKNEKIS